MAGVVRLSCGRVVQKYFCSLGSQTARRNFKLKQRICFHTSQLLDSQEIKMPSLSPTMTEGTIVQWLKKEGDAVVPGDVLCEIQTDKAVMAFETEEEGILAKILEHPLRLNLQFFPYPMPYVGNPDEKQSDIFLQYPNPYSYPLVQNGTKDVKVGTLIGLLVEEGEDWRSVDVQSASAASASSGGVGTSALGGAPSSRDSSSSSGGGGTVPGNPVNMPALSPTMTEGTIVAWKKKEGDSFAPGDALCEIQTDKAVMTFETEEEGILAKVLVKEGSVVKVGTLIAVYVDPGADWKQAIIPGASAAVATPSTPAEPTPSAAPQFDAGSVPGNHVNMPALSPTMTEGTIVAWKKKEGDSFAPGDALCEIQTDKAVMTFEMEEEGILAKVLAKEGSVVKVGTLIAVYVDPGADWKQVSEAVGTGAPAPAAAATSATPQFVGGSVPGSEIKMPSLSPTMAEGQIVNWIKKEGDKLSPGDVLCEIQTDKAVMAFEFEDEAILAKILTPANSGPIKVGQLIALTVEEGQDWKDVAIPAATSAPAAAAVAPAPKAPAAPRPTPAAAAPAPSGFHLVGDFAPAVRALLERYQITGKEITATGRKQKLLKGDVLKYIADKQLQPKPPVAVPLPGKPSAAGVSAVGQPGVGAAPKADYTDVEVSTMRRVIAQRLTQSKTEIPHGYSTLRADIDNLISARKQLAGLGVKVSVNDFVVKAVAKALRQCPFVNATFVKDQILPSSTVDISIAVATDNGLITPIVKNADQKSIDEISAEVRDLAGKARKGKLQPHEFQGGSFTISNLGMFGITEFSAIINPPQCAILAVGGGQPLVKSNGEAATVMSATLSYDGRAISEDEVAAFMEVVTGYLENPASLLLTGSIKPKVISKAEEIL